MMVTGKTTNPVRNKGSFGFWIFIVICVYFALSLYWAITALNWSIILRSDPYVYQQLSKGPWWWMILFYGSEGITGTIGVVLRAVAGFFALYVAFLYWRKKESALPSIKRKVSAALILEASYYLSLSLSVFAAFVYNISNENLWYFDGTPKTVLLFVTALPCLAMILTIPPLLFKLRSKITHGFQREEVIKWGAITSVAYLFVVFWFNYTMAWAANSIQYWPYYRAPGPYGLSFILEPVNFAAFLLTVVGLFLIALFALVSILPAIKKQAFKSPSLKRVGITMTALGSYFILVLSLYFVAGGYDAHRTPWYEIISPYHNPDLWCITFLFAGLAALWISRKSKE